RRDEERFAAVEEQVSATLRFPGERLATFTVAFGAARLGWFEIVGDKGAVRVGPAYEYEGAPKYPPPVGGQKPKKESYTSRDQIAPEISHFSDCILQGRDPQPSGEEGLADVRIIRALYRSIDEGRPVRFGNGHATQTRPARAGEPAATAHPAEPAPG